MTCNPEWEEIAEQLHPGQTHNDRPDLTSRIFRAKLQDLKDQLFKKVIFGKVAAHVHVIEFQKRGLPHAHILIILIRDHKIILSDQYDKYVSAEISDQSKHPILYELTIWERISRKFNLPPVQPNPNLEGISYPREIQDEPTVQIPIEDLNAESTLNSEQYNAYTSVLSRVQANKSRIFFIDGLGGTGKTFLYRALLAKVRLEGMITLATTTSSVAAVIIPGGRTLHSRFKIKIPTTESSMCSISKQDGTSKLIKIARLIIWDEAPMGKRVAIEILDITLRDIMDRDHPFGGKVIVFDVDFRQVLPVVPRATRSQTVRESLVSSYLWRKMEKLKLSKNMRAMTDSTFSDFLLRVGNGDEPTVADDLIALPTSILIKNQSIDLPEDCLIKSIFPSLDKNFQSIDYMKDRAILATKNEYADMLNDRIIK
ncbi:ATP-dependent DNA helicase PIF1-like [Asparagus officinalis]|uniref:ATP-dependent DNA helicase PIF1-like n=1 Tax=Asparagus officinalis TaxID=4686 RepID=UPI00098E2E17|nr:ATP-dependent DNA helicase PIF1-like [Asparagus officinalis]